MAAFIEAIMLEVASIPLHPFIIEVFDYLNVVPLQFTPNSICTIVAFYITFIEADISESSMMEFTYVYSIKALARNGGF